MTIPEAPRFATADQARHVKGLLCDAVVLDPAGIHAIGQLLDLGPPILDNFPDQGIPGDSRQWRFLGQALFDAGFIRTGRLPIPDAALGLPIVAHFDIARIPPRAHRTVCHTTYLVSAQATTEPYLVHGLFKRTLCNYSGSEFAPETAIPQAFETPDEAISAAKISVLVGFNEAEAVRAAVGELVVDESFRYLHVSGDTPND